MTVWLKDTEGSWHKIKCETYEYIKGAYVFFDKDAKRVANYIEANIIGFKIKRKAEKNGNKQG